MGYRVHGTRSSKSVTLVPGHLFSFTILTAKLDAGNLLVQIIIRMEAKVIFTWYTISGRGVVDLYLYFGYRMDLVFVECLNLRGLLRENGKLVKLNLCLIDK